MMRTTVVLLLISPVLGASPVTAKQVGDTVVVTLAQCEEWALERNLVIRGAELGLATAEAKRIQASRAKILPQLSMRNVWGPINRARGVVDPVTGFVTSPDTSTSVGDLRYFTQLDIDILQPLFTFGKLSNLSDAAQFGVEADEFKLESEHDNVRFQVRQLYWGLVLGKEVLAIIRDVDRELESAEQKVQEKLDEGSDEVSQTDLFKLQIFRYETNKRLREATDNVALTEATLRATIGMDTEVVVSPANEYLEPVEITLDSLPWYFDVADRSQPELARLRAGVNARQALVRSQRSDFYPQLFFRGQITYNFAKDRFDPRNPFLYSPTNFFRPGFVLGANMNLNFWQTRDRVRVAQAEADQLAQQEEQLSAGLRLQVRQSYLELLQAQDNMRDSRAGARASQNWLRSATMTFDIGVGEVKDLIDAFKANTVMQAEHLQNIFKFNVAAAKLGKVIGSDIYPQ